MRGAPGYCFTGIGTVSASLDQLSSLGDRYGSRDLDVTGQHTRSFVRKLDSLRLPTVTIDSE